MSVLDTFFAAWSETDPGKRADLIGQAIAEGFTYSDPRSGARLDGLGPTADYVGNFSANAPGWTASVETEDAVNGYLRATVRFGGMGPDGKEMSQTGTYFADTDEDGKLTLLAGFAG